MAKTTEELRAELNEMFPPAEPQPIISPIEYKKRIIDVALTQLVGSGWAENAPAYQHLLRLPIEEVKAILKWEG